MQKRRLSVSLIAIALLGIAPAVVPVGPHVVDAQAAACSPTESTFTGDGTIGTSGVDYNVLLFTSTGSCDWTVPSGVTTIDYLIVGAGGAGGSTKVGSAGGGGGGQVLESSGFDVSAVPSISVVVGAGGSSTVPPIDDPDPGADTNPSSGEDGDSSSLTPSGGSTITALGGSGGANAWLYDSDNSTQLTPSAAGWNGGGGSSHAGTRSLGSAGGGGFAGGDAHADGLNSNPQAGGGGGGSGGDGADASSGAGGDGGSGAASTIRGSSANYGGGGGGGKRTSSGPSGSGIDGGGAGGKRDDGVSGTANSGGGGGGGAGDEPDTLYSGGAGGSGVVIVRYALTPDAPTSTSVASGDEEMTLTYTAPTSWGGGTLDIEYTTDNGPNWRSLGETDGNTTVSLESDGTALQNNTLYTVKLRSTNTVGGSSYTSSVVTVGDVMYGEVLRFDATNPDSYGGTGPTWTDLAASRTGTTQGDASFDARSKAFEFDGTGDYIDVSDITTDFVNGLAIHAVVDFGDDQNNYERVLEFTDNDGTAGNIVFGRYSTEDALYFEVYQGSTSSNCYSRDDAIRDGFHAYSVILSSGGVCTFQRDGVTLTDNQDSSALIPDTVVRDTNYLGKARAGATGDFEGSIQSVVMYNTAQTTPTCLPLSDTMTGDGTVGEQSVPYTLLAFTTAGTCNWSVPNGVTTVEALVVAGGGGGGAHVASGGGAGGVVEVDPSSDTSGTGGLDALDGVTDVDITVGTGGSGAHLFAGGCGNPTTGITGGEVDTGSDECNDPDVHTRAQNGGASSVEGFTVASGGGSGGSWDYYYPGDGGSGAGASSSSGDAGAGTGTVGQGNAGGAYSGSYLSGGGGGWGAAGSPGAGASPGAGGAGDTTTILSSTKATAWSVGEVVSSSVYFAGGGGGGYHDGDAEASGGTGGGGEGDGDGVSGTVGQRGLALSGGGGGGGADANTDTSRGGDGGSGIVIVRYTLSPGAPTISSISPGDSSVSVTFSAPSHTGGAAIEDYEYSLDGTNWSSLATTSAGTKTISGLTNGTAYTIRLRAVNNNGNGGVATSSSVTPAVSSSGSSDDRDDESPTTTPTPPQQPVAGPTLPRSPRLPLPPTPAPRPEVLTGPVTPPATPTGADPRARGFVGGIPAPVTSTPRGDGGVEVTTGTLRMGLRPVSPPTRGATPPTGIPGLTVEHGRETTVNGGGLLPGSQLQVFLTGAGDRELGRIPVQTDGSFDGSLAFRSEAGQMPLPIGQSTLQAVGYDSDGNQTVVEMPVNIAQGAPAPEPNRQVGELPDLAQGDSLATSAGLPEPLAITAFPDDGRVEMTSGQWQFNVTVGDNEGAVRQLDNSAELRLTQEQVAQATGQGFQSSTRVDIWLFSEPTLLASVIVGDDGSFAGEFYLDPRFATAGEHTLQLQGVGTDGYVKAVNLGVVVDEPPAATTASAAWMLVGWSAVAALALVLLVVVLARRRRQHQRVGIQH